MGPPRRPIVRTTVLLACALLIATGCTARQSRQQYEERLEQALDVRTQVTRKLEAGELQSPQDYQQESERVQSAVEQLDADPPPRDAEHAHESMVSGMEGLAVLLSRLGRCEALGSASEQDRRVCRQSIEQQVYDDIRNDFTEANTIYREEGFSLPGLGAQEGTGDSLGQDPEGGDEL